MKTLRSKINQVDARVKLLLSIVISLLIFAIPTLLFLFVLLLSVCGALLIVRPTWQRLKPAVMMLGSLSVMILVLHAFSQTMMVGMLVVLQMSILIFSSQLLVLTTSEGALIDAFCTLLRPLDRWLPVDRLGMMLLTILRLVGIIRQQFHSIQEAQMAKGNVKSIFSIMLPLLIRTFHSADQMSEAMKARGMLE